MLSERLGLHHVRFTGRLSSQDLYALTSTARFAVVPSEWYENCPYSLLEAMALGTPILATNIGGIPELMDDGVEGILVTPRNVAAMAEGISRMLHEGRDLARMGEAGRSRVARSHHPDAYVSALSRVYASLGAGEI
jgi:glycosyltransferase involved in cell wall biosynthesis